MTRPESSEHRRRGVITEGRSSRINVYRGRTGVPWPSSGGTARGEGSDESGGETSRGCGMHAKQRQTCTKQQVFEELFSTKEIKAEDEGEVEMNAERSTMRLRRQTMKRFIDFVLARQG